jgi:hypothetical protein
VIDFPAPRAGERVRFTVEDEVVLAEHSGDGNFEFDTTEWREIFPQDSIVSFEVISKRPLKEGDVITVDDFDRLPKHVVLEIGPLLAPMWRTVGQWHYGGNGLTPREAKSYLASNGPARILKLGSDGDA